MTQMKLPKKTLDRIRRIKAEDAARYLRRREQQIKQQAQRHILNNRPIETPSSLSEV